VWIWKRKDQESLEPKRDDRESVELKERVQGVLPKITKIKYGRGI
jgi:hypothetical protein